MIRVFIDTDVIIDFLTDRKPFSESAALLFNRIDKNEISGYTSSQSISNLYYILRKYGSHKRVIQVLAELNRIIGILPVNQKTIRMAMQSGFNDLEDAIQYYCADLGHMDAFVTRNVRDYKEAKLPVVSPETLEYRDA